MVGDSAFAGSPFFFIAFRAAVGIPLANAMSTRTWATGRWRNTETMWITCLVLVPRVVQMWYKTEHKKH